MGQTFTETAGAVGYHAISKARSTFYAWVVFALIFALLMSDYMSRQVLNAVFPHLKLEWGLTDGQLGSLSGIVALMVGLLTLPFSLLADRWGRVKSLAIMALLWSASTLACGLAANYGHMLAARFFVGVGEAACGSVGLAVILSAFPASMRATLTGAFTSGGMFGAVLGMALGGVVATHFGWRAAFVAMALFGLVVVLFYALIVTEGRLARRTHAGAMAAIANTRAAGRDSLPLPATLRAVFGAPSLVFAYLGSGLQLFTVFAIVAWMPSYLNRYYSMAPDKSALAAAVLLIVSGVGMTLCGILTDWISRKAPGRKVKLAYIYCLLSCVLLMAALRLAPGNAQLLLISGGVLVAAGTWGPAGAMVANLARPAIHSTALATLTLANNLLGAAPAPFLTGVLADHIGLLGALQVVPLVSLAAATLFILAGRKYQRDLALAEQQNEVERAAERAST
ncbi:Sugar phosphate permease (plasmid) [Cupriavidus taiwanensis]|uniref:Sugar phosphate permease n=1 Tax=Cupriavidus taiwanensis TaxID=164546 RepID=A0A375IPS1_9BURK|nr:MFS transporter [Cupriavidus taiwanensis]SPK76108.1 Sugar phosphate permease [Cupriavidus taiwanensis]